MMLSQIGKQRENETSFFKTSTKTKVEVFGKGKAEGTLPFCWLKPKNILLRMIKNDILKNRLLIFCLLAFFHSCQQEASKSTESEEIVEHQFQADSLNHNSAIQPILISQKVKYDTDDPAIWINPQNPDASIIFGTDKAEDGAVYAFNLNGDILEDLVIKDMQRPNNCDIAYGLEINGELQDVLVFTERYRSMIRVFAVPSMHALDNGGIPVFEGEPTEDERAPMGIATYFNSNTKQHFVMVSRKNGYSGEYIWQYKLAFVDDPRQTIQGELVRKFGAFCGTGEIEAIAVDEPSGTVFYSDEAYGIRQYWADPSAGSQEISSFGVGGFKEDREGIAIWHTDDENGYIVVSDQSGGALRFFDFKDHSFIKTFQYSALQTDGIAISTQSFSNFPNGLLVAMSTDQTFHFYGLEQFKFD